MMQKQTTAQTYLEAARHIPVIREVDVLVVGAGPAGIGAAVRAAREGANTLLVEAHSMLGGMWTASMQVHATCFFSGGKVVVGGLIRELIDRLARAGWAEDPDDKIRTHPGAWAVHFEPEWMKCFLDDLVMESGAQLLLHTMCVGAIVDDGRVRGIVTESKSGRQAILAGVTIDCTGDGDVTHLSGAAWVKGRASDGKCQPVNTTFLLAGVDYGKALAWGEAKPGRITELCREAHRTGELQGQFKISGIGARTMYPDVTYHNKGHVFDIDITRAEDLTRAEIEGRRQVRQIYQFYRKHVPGFEKAHIAAIAPGVGLRESRRLVGEYTLTQDDVVKARKFPDGIAAHAYYIDVHSANGLQLEPGIDTSARPPAGEHYEVPYRCLVPVKVDQLLVAGRCISADRAALGSARTTVCCMELGEAAGLAASVAVRQGIRVREVDGTALRNRLLGPSR